MFEREVKQQVEYVKEGRPLFANVTSRFPRECVNNGPVLCSLKVRKRHYGAAPADSQQSNSATRESRLNRRTPVSRLHFSLPASIPVWVVCSQRSAHTGRGGLAVYSRRLFTSRLKWTGRDMKECRIRRRRWCGLTQDGRRVAKPQSHPRDEEHCG